MTKGQVTATSLNLRSAPAPDGAIVDFLVKGTVVTILESSDKWLRVSTVGPGPTRSGWVSGDFVAKDGAAGPPNGAPPSIPPAEDSTHKVTTDGNKAIGPDGKSFATKKNQGFYTLGVTSLRAWLDATSPPFPASVRNVVRAVSLNEGKLEAINSYDNAFLSVGVFQWTAGPEDDPGELAGLLEMILEKEPQAFQDYFGSYGLGVKVTSKAQGRLTTGYLTLDGNVLDRVADKQQLRSPVWAYRFWRAGHDDRVRTQQLHCAAARIAVFLGKAVANFTVGEWLTSEYGIALVLDEHVNRPGHVPGTLGKAVARLGGTPNPAGWTTTDEGRLIDLYIEERDKTNMTDAANRATRIGDCVHNSTLSDRRGSFVSVVE